MTGITTLQAGFKARGAEFSIDARTGTVTLSLPEGRPAPGAKELFYNALDGLEPFFTVFIKGAPFCYMPDAMDHILYRRRPGRSYSAIRQCGACALNGLCPGIETGSAFHGELRRTLRPVLPFPRELVFELTKRCNLACRACSVSKTAQEPPLKKLLAELGKAKALGIENIRFTGGEPFLSRNLLPMLKASRRMGFYTLVNTNAAGADRALLEEAAPLMDNVLVSLQGRDDGSESRATGVRGLFSLKLANMVFLRSRVRTFRLGTVASKSLLKEFRAYHALAVKLKADIWEIYRPMRSGGAAAGKEFDLKAADMRRLSSLIADLKPGGPRVLLANPLPLCLVPPAERKNLLGAAFDDGHTRLVYDPRGFYKPSYYIEERLGAGIKKAWRSGYMRTLRSYSWLPARCKACDLLLKCLGGSRCLAKNANGNYFAADPWFPGHKK